MERDEEVLREDRRLRLREDLVDGVARVAQYDELRQHVHDVALVETRDDRHVNAGILLKDAAKTNMRCAFEERSLVMCTSVCVRVVCARACL